MWRDRRALAKGLLLAVLGLAVSCKTSEDARAVASQMTAAASDLNDYYDALAQLVDNHAKLERLQQAMLAVPLDKQDLAQLQDVETALQKRAAAAHELAKLAEAFGGLSGSKAPEDVSNSAANLGTALSAIPKLPGGSDATAVLENAGKILTQVAQEHDQRKMARNMEPTMAGLAQMFSQEKPTYDSIDRTYIGLAQGVALDMLNHNQVNPASLMEPALKPFDLASRIPAEQVPEGLKDYAREQIKGGGDAEIAAHARASDAMEGALKELSKRTHELATDGRMPERGFTISLEEVESWVRLILK
jgi:hypothetical protein